jgi:hypothetical protein
MPGTRSDNSTSYQMIPSRMSEEAGFPVAARWMAGPNDLFVRWKMEIFMRDELVFVSHRVEAKSLELYQIEWRQDKPPLPSPHYANAMRRLGWKLPPAATLRWWPRQVFHRAWREINNRSPQSRRAPLPSPVEAFVSMGLAWRYVDDSSFQRQGYTINLSVHKNEAAGEESQANNLFVGFLPVGPHCPSLVCCCCMSFLDIQDRPIARWSPCPLGSLDCDVLLPKTAAEPTSEIKDLRHRADWQRWSDPTVELYRRSHRAASGIPVVANSVPTTDT